MYKREIKGPNWIFDNIGNLIALLKDLNVKNKMQIHG
jgi:hypothetical protein